VTERRPVVAVGGIAIDDDRVLLIQRGREPGLGKWTIPGGRVELGESLRGACARELREETGLEVDVGELVELVERVVRGPDGAIAFHYVIHDFLVRVTGGALAAGSDVTDARFVRRADLDQLPVTDGLAPVVDRALALARGKG
jgi:ADP-ribose pyrophosphatase